VARGGPVQIMPPQLAQPAGQIQPVVPPRASQVPAHPAPDPTAPLRTQEPLPGGRGAAIDSPSTQPPVQQAAFVSPQRPEDASGGEGYVVQLASFRSEDEALNDYKRLTQRHSGLVSGLKPRVQEASLGQNVTFYRLGIGPLVDKTAATKLCNSLIAAGEKDCLVRRF
jgi:cell division septation protein DedD